MSPSSTLLLDGRLLLDAEHILASGMADRRASFELGIASLPETWGFAVVAGVEAMLHRLTRPLCDPADIERLRKIVPLGDALVARLTKLAPKVDIDAAFEGSIAFARTPILTLEGPLLDALLLGPIIEATVPFSTEIATRAARLHIAAGSDAIIDGASARAGSLQEALDLARAAHVGGAAGTTNTLAAAALNIPFRASRTLDTSPSAATSQGWGESPADRVLDLDDDDEEAMIVELCRRGARGGGFLARSLARSMTPGLRLRYALVAVEEKGAWSPRRGVHDELAILPGRKHAARYFDEAGHAVADLVHLATERIPTPKSFKAATLAPTTRAVMRAGRALEASELPTAGRERSIAARQMLAPEVLFLRSPGAYRVEQSTGLRDLRRELASRG